MPRSPLCSFIAATLLFSASVSWAADIKVEVLQSKLDHPWSLAFLPDSKGMLITLRDG